jgi:hypothetical protein
MWILVKKNKCQISISKEEDRWQIWTFVEKIYVKFESYWKKIDVKFEP